MRFIEKEHQLGFIEVAHFGQLLKQLGQHPKQKRGVKPWRIHQLVGGQDVHQAMAVAIGLHEVVDVEHGLAEKLVATLLFNLQQAPLNRAHAGGADVAVRGGEVFGVLAHMLQHGAQVFQVQQQPACIVSNLEHQVQHTGLGLVQVQHAGQQERPHVTDRGPHRMALLTKNVPQGHGAGRKSGRGQTAFFQNARHLLGQLARLAHAGQVAFDVGHEDRHADAGQALGHGLQGDGFARSGGTGDQAMAIGQFGQQKAVGSATARNQDRL